MEVELAEALEEPLAAPAEVADAPEPDELLEPEPEVPVTLAMISVEPALVTVTPSTAPPETMVVPLGPTLTTIPVALPMAIVSRPVVRPAGMVATVGRAAWEVATDGSLVMTEG